MNGIHDMGGMHGFGRIAREENEPVFHHTWQGRAYAIHVMTPVAVPGGFRYAIECMDPAHYLASSYYEKWLFVQTQGMIEAGVFTQEDYDFRLAHFRSNPNADPPQREDPALARQVVKDIRKPESLRKEINRAPAFDIGDAVKARNMHPIGHSRLPRYAKGKHGVVEQCYGIQDFGDTMPPGIEARPQPLYAVRFEAKELWGEFAEPNSAVYLNMWESYLEPE